MGKIQKMIDYAVAIANDDSHGYSQTRRWKSQGTDRDCSSLMYEAANAAGYNVTVGPSGTHYTGTMIEDFENAGFTVLRFDGNLYDLDKGDILVRDPWGDDGHTEMYIGNNQLVGAHGSEYGTADGEPGDQTGGEISVVGVYGNWDYVLMPPKEDTVTTSTNKLNGTYKVVASPFTHVRDKASTVKGAIKAQVKTGTKLSLTNVRVNSAGNTWGKVASGTHKGRYVCVKFKGYTLLKKA